MFAWSCNIKQHLANNGRHAKIYTLKRQNLRVYSSGFWWHKLHSSFWWQRCLPLCSLHNIPCNFAPRFWQIAGPCHQLSPPLLPIHIWQYLRTQAMPVEIIVAVITTPMAWSPETRSNFGTFSLNMEFKMALNLLLGGV